MTHTLVIHPQQVRIDSLRQDIRRIDEELIAIDAFRRSNPLVTQDVSGDTPLHKKHYKAGWREHDLKDDREALVRELKKLE